MSEAEGLKQIDTEMSTLLSNFSKSVGRLKGKAEDQERVARCEELMKRFDLAMENYQVDLGSVNDASIRREYSTKLDKHMEKFSGLKFQYAEKKRDFEQKSFLKREKEIEKAGKSMTGDEDISTLNRTQAIAMGDIQISKGNESIEKSKQMALEAETIGTTTLQKMNEQNEKMDSIYEGLEEIEGNLARSRQLLGKIAQGAANDKFIQLLCVLIFIAVVVAITLDKTSKKNAAQSNTVGTNRRLEEIISVYFTI